MANRKDDKTWLAIRTAYIVKRWSAQKCAECFHVDATTIRKRASKEGWTRERHRNATASRSVAEEETRNVVRDESARRQQLMDALIVWAAKQIQDSEADLALIKIPRSRISARRDIMEMVDRFVKTGKLADEDRPTERDDEMIIEQRRLEPMKIAVGQDGRALPRPNDDDEE